MKNKNITTEYGPYSHKDLVKYYAEHQDIRLHRSARQRAERKGIDFTISISDIKIPKRCPYLGIKLTNTLGKGRVYSNASIDRIDNSKGYIPDNIQVVSDLANKMKQDARPDQLIEFAKHILLMEGYIVY